MTARRVRWMTLGVIGMLSLAVTALVLCWPRLVSAAPAGGVVGTGTPASCTEAALDTALVGGGTITFNCGSAPYTITLRSYKTIATNTTIDGGGKITLSGGHSNRLFSVSVGRSLTVKGITLADGESTYGGCVHVLGAFSAYSTILRNCHGVPGFIFSLPSGGAIVALNANLYLSNTQVLNNVADLHGGGIYMSASSMASV